MNRRGMKKKQRGLREYIDKVIYQRMMKEDLALAREYYSTRRHKHDILLEEEIKFHEHIPE